MTKAPFELLIHKALLTINDLLKLPHSYPASTFHKDRKLPYAHIEFMIIISNNINNIS